MIRKKVNEFGWFNNATEPVSLKVGGKIVWHCPYYRLWFAMKNRVSSQKLHKIRPTYSECSVDESWQRFLDFKEDMISMGWKEGLVLDKDIIVRGNKHYSKDLCSLIPEQLNSFLTNERADNTSGIAGVHYQKNGRGLKRWVARCKNPRNGKRECLGYFYCKYEAGLKYWQTKHEHSLWWSEQISNTKVREALKTRFLTDIDTMQNLLHNHSCEESCRKE